jgi:hypothetical protein
MKDAKRPHFIQKIKQKLKEVLMRKKILMGSTVFIFVALLFTACGGGGGSPENIPKAFYAAMAKGNVDAMQKMTTGSFTAEAAKSAEQSKNIKISISAWKVKEVKDIGEDKKSVRVEFVSKVEPKGSGFARKMKQDQIFHLKRVDKKWLVEKVSQASPPISVD